MCTNYYCKFQFTLDIVMDYNREYRSVADEEFI